MAKTTEKVKPSDRAKALQKLETPEEIQADIQRMYADSAKLLLKGEKHRLKSMAESQRIHLGHYVSEVKDITTLKLDALKKFWYNAHYHYETITNLLNE